MTHRVLRATCVQPAPRVFTYFVRSVPLRCTLVFLQATRELVALACDIRSSPGGNEFLELERIPQLARQEGFHFDLGVS